MQNREELQQWEVSLVCLLYTSSAADSGAVGGHLPHDLLHDPDESAGGAVLLRGSGSWVMKLADGGEVLKMLITAFVVFVLPYICLLYTSRCV